MTFILRHRKLQLLSAHSANGGVLALCQSREILLATVTTTVHAFQFKVKQRANGLVEAAELKLVSSHKSDKNNFLTCLDAQDKLIVAGDLMTSISIYNLVENTLDEVAYHPYPFWTSAVHVVDEKNVLVAVDQDLYSYTLTGNQKIVEPKDVSHTGQRINRFGRGSLVMQQIKTKYAQQAELASQLPKTSQLLTLMPQREIPTILYATACGAIGIIALIPEHTFKYLSALKDAMVTHISFLGDTSYTELKTALSVKSKTPMHEGSQFIDGDFVETYLNLDKKLAEEIYTAIHYHQKPTMKDTYILLRQLFLLH